MARKGKNMTRIKLCGLTREEDIDAANRLMPEYAGFVFAKKSRRYINENRAYELKKRLSGEIKAVGVFVDAPAAYPIELLRRGVIDLAQLHGNESEEEIRMIRQETGRQVIRAFRVTGPEDVLRAQESDADYLLFDAGAGDGRVFDWALLEKCGRPYFLAGGLDADNVREAVGRLHPYAVDVSSGIETGGYKDPEKMAAFVDAVRKMEQ